MSYRPVLRVCAATALTLVLGAAAAAPASAEPAPASADVLAAMQRDFGLTAAAAQQRLAAEQTAALTDAWLAPQLGERYAGSWIDESGGLVVGTTDAADSAAIRAAGATPLVRAAAQSDLDEVMARLNGTAQAQTRSAPVSVPDEIGAWYIDTAAGVVVVEAVDVAAGEAFAAAAGDLESLVQVQQVATIPQPFADLIGGEAIYAVAGGRCSVGFSARSGGTAFVITAGHCTEIGGNWQGVNRQVIGPVASTSFPGDDYGTIQVTNTGAWTPTSRVAGTQSVLGSTVAAINASTCRSGSTTGYRCGVIQSRDATVNYGGGDVVYGLTRTSACAEPGDSGGSYVSGRQAQGMTSGGSGNCSSGGTTYFQPVNEALSARGLTLVVG